MPQAETQAAPTAIRQGLLLSITGATLLSFETLLLRLVTVDVWSVLWWRGIFVGAAVALYLLLSRRSLSFLDLQRWAEGLAVLAYAFSIICFVSAIQHTSVANTLVIGSAAPFMASFLSWIFLRERPPATTWIVAVMLVAGLFVIFFDSLQTDHLFGDVCALGYASFLGAYFVALKRCRPEALFPVIGYGGLFSAALAWSYASPVATSGTDMMFLALLGVLVVPLATLLLARGTQHLAAPDVTLIMMLETILGPIWVWLAMGETPDRATFAGGALIIATVIAHAYLSARKSAPA
jgi:drug/metabolite transporter (DMT)-like permease